MEIVLRQDSIGEMYNIGSGVKRRGIDVSRRILDIVTTSDDQIGS
ncbi:hypothetical protein SAMN05216564_104308 [Halopenitus persicus]|uniref:Uncharacterized protein n=1 Tax=Halopenitus persicus TaxID=1048396 RepID=A0A1H3IXY5_9EURY|nr:hypothetical protein SAMN05216564_104308 [Halopenitus persicus]